MFKRKLKALDYLEWDKVNGNDPQHFRKVIVWLEDQKIRHYKIEDRKDLRNINSKNWSEAFKKYCTDVKCPVTGSELEQLEWFIGHAICLEYEDNCKKYQEAATNKINNKNDVAVPNMKSTNPLDNLNFDSNEFKNGVDALAKLLKVPKHPDHLVTLQACSKVVCKRLNTNAVANPNSVIVKGKPYPILETSAGFNTGDAVLDKAARCLALLYIHDLRGLQTKINETIVSVQNITANPKTDTKLGKVGI